MVVPRSSAPLEYGNPELPSLKIGNNLNFNIIYFHNSLIRAVVTCSGDNTTQVCVEQTKNNIWAKAIGLIDRHCSLEVNHATHEVPSLSENMENVDSKLERLDWKAEVQKSHNFGNSGYKSIPTTS